ncbi:hypothetical protein D3C80_1687230 [compost metagenome]
MIGSGEAGRSGDIAVLPVAAMLVADAVERRQDLFGEACAFFENGVQRIAVHRLATLQLLVVARQVEQFMDDEAQVAHGGLVAGHAGIPDDWKNVWFFISRRRARASYPEVDLGVEAGGEAGGLSPAGSMRGRPAVRRRGRPHRVCGTGC